MDFCYVTEFAKYTIIHIVGAATGFSATRLSYSKFISESMKSLELSLIKQYGVSNNFTAHPEILNKCTSELNYFKINFHQTPSRLHKNICVVERKHSVVHM